MERRANLADYPAAFLEKLGELEEKIGYSFQNRMYLVTALTHSSFSKEKEKQLRLKFDYNERQEFLGDSVLSLAVSEYLFSRSSSLSEGVLTKLRAASVCADALFEYAEEISLGAYMLLNHGLEETGGRHSKNILADCFEALIAGVFLDGGGEKAKAFVLRFAVPKLQALTKGGFLHDRDYKSLLQQKVQTSPGERMEYVLSGEEGPDHDKVFTMDLYLNSNLIGRGSGHSKREAEQAAAKVALETWFGEK